MDVAGLYFLEKHGFPVWKSLCPQSYISGLKNLYRSGFAATDKETTHSSVFFGPRYA